MRLAPLLIGLALFLPPAIAQGTLEERTARVTLQRQSDSGILQVELLPANAWSGDVFVSLYRGDFRERKGIRPNDAGEYRLEVRVPEAGEWGIYLRYGFAQAGYAGYSRLRVPAEGGTAATVVELDSGFASEVPGYVQPLGFAVFALIAALSVLGLRWILQSIRERQAAATLTAVPHD